MAGADDTIFALSTAPGRAGIAVVRVSGPAVREALDALAGGPPAPRRASLRRLMDGDGGEIDRALVLFFPAPASFTGQDSAEFHVHGGPAVVAATLGALGRLPGCRPAEPGEFARRAFDNGRLDLTEVEGLADMIAAETEAQRRLALRQMSGALGALYDGWRTGLVRCLAHVEAAIDFPDEALPDDLMDRVAPELDRIGSEIRGHLDDGGRGERVRAGISIAIAGAPNAGKSSLLNALARRDVAIVAETAGTTRDVIEAHLDLGGYAVTVADTAGLRALDAADMTPVEAEGIARARARAAAADLSLVVFDGCRRPPPESVALLGPDSIAVVNKVDLGAEDPGIGALPGPLFRTSARTGQGLASLTDAVTARIVARYGVGEAPALTRQRHRAALEQAAAALAASRRAELPELAAEDLRLAVRALGRITGRVDVEDLLDVIFRDFCIGK